MTDYTYKYKLPPSARNKDEEEIKDIPLKPLLDIQLYNPDKGKAKRFEGLVDSGADGLHIPKEIAEALGLEKYEEMTSSGAYGSTKCIITKVGFKIGRGKARRTDFGPIRATFPKEKIDRMILVGRYPLFEYFEVRFQEYKNSAKIKLIQEKDPSS